MTGERKKKKEQKIGKMVEKQEEKLSIRWKNKGKTQTQTTN